MLDKYSKKGFLKIDGLSFDHVIPRIPRSSGSHVCRITLPKELDGVPVFVLVDYNKKKKEGGYDDPVLHI